MADPIDLKRRRVELYISSDVANDQDTHARIAVEDADEAASCSSQSGSIEDTSQEATFSSPETSTSSGDGLLFLPSFCTFKTKLFC